MTALVLGVIGHVDHGKTALVRALTGIDTDRLGEEKRRGISIALGFAHLQTGAETHIDLIDMPGHERFVRNMVSGATGIDAVLLVVAADEGVKPQSVEHVEIASLLGVRQALVAISKTDLAAPDQAARTASQSVDLLLRSGIEVEAVVMTSTRLEAGIEELREALARLARHRHKPPARGLAFLPMDRAFSIAGHGSVVTGTLRGAAIRPGDRLDLLPSGRSVQVREVQVHGVRVAAAEPGQRAAVNLRNVPISDLKRGMVIASPASLKPSAWLSVAIRTTRGAPPLRNGVQLRALLGTEQVDVRLRLLDRDVLESGETGFAQLHCSRPVTLPPGEHVILRLASPVTTVAGGKVLESVTGRRQRKNAQILQRLTNLRDLPVAGIIAAEVEHEGSSGTRLKHLSSLCAHPEAAIEQMLADLPVIITRHGLIFRQKDLQQLTLQIPQLLVGHPAGLSRNQLLSALQGARAGLCDEALARLVAQGAIARRGSHFLFPRPEEDEAIAQGEAALAARIEETVRLGGLTPPLPAAIVPDARSRHAADRLLRSGILIRAVDRAKGKELLFHREAIDDAKRRLEPHVATAPGLLVTEIASLLGISRKFTMPLLAHLDAARFLVRVGDRRIAWSAAGTGVGAGPKAVSGLSAPVISPIDQADEC